MKYCVVFITTPPDRAQEIANLIVERKLGACVNIVGKVKSIYWWQGNIERDDESLLIVKTRLDLFKKLKEEVKRVHPYTVPEIVALPIVEGNEDYLNWIDESVENS